MTQSQSMGNREQGTGMAQTQTMGGMLQSQGFGQGQHQILSGNNE